MPLSVTQDAAGADALANFKAWDLGDILGCEGTLFRTKIGELSVKASSVRLLTKSLRPLPDKFHGMTDQEQKYRQRYVELMTDDERVVIERYLGAIEQIDQPATP